MDPKMVQKATPNPPKTDQEGGLKKEPVRGPKLNAKGSILGGPGGVLFGTLFGPFWGSNFGCFPKALLERKKGALRPLGNNLARGLGPQGPMGSALRHDL